MTFIMIHPNVSVVRGNTFDGFHVCHVRLPGVGHVRVFHHREGAIEHADGLGPVWHLGVPRTQIHSTKFCLAKHFFKIHAAAHIPTLEAFARKSTSGKKAVRLG